MRKETRVTTLKTKRILTPVYKLFGNLPFLFYCPKGLILWRKWVLRSDVRVQRVLLSDHSPP